MWLKLVYLLFTLISIRNLYLRKNFVVRTYAVLNKQKVIIICDQGSLGTLITG
ncbi:hypothetical protein KFK09_026502 [Dendrobium nobile]|uniref:Uncharacterized protein n=1 Tax=Dendrobium nobile TaxID=94219 RepID=A0A8T3A816_DENNO|nr:hypothetical protein KFK09_026502 [Dendrobium nobile]